MEETDQQLIERYLANDLSDIERTDFERRRREDAVFNQEVEDYEYAKEALVIKERDALRSRIKGWDLDLDTGKQEEKKPKKFNLLWLAVAAIVLISLLLWKFLFTPDHPDTIQFVNDKDTIEINKNKPGPDTLSPEELKKQGIDSRGNNQDKKKPQFADASGKGEELFAENFEPYKNNSMSPDARGENLSPIDQFRKYYWDGQYKEAMKVFSKLGQEYQNNDNLRFVYAMALTADEKYEVAQLELANIIRHKKSIYVEEATWYLGLLYLKQGDMANAKKYLQSCVDAPDGYNKDKARILLNKIK